MGECLYLLDIGPGGVLRLLRADSRDVWGEGPDPAGWWYRLTITGPRSTRTVTAPAASVVHLRYATEAHAPARGLSPLQGLSRSLLNFASGGLPVSAPSRLFYATSATAPSGGASASKAPTR